LTISGDPEQVNLLIVAANQIQTNVTALQNLLKGKPVPTPFIRTLDQDAKALETLNAKKPPIQ
jgi:hypothetical protein